MKIGKLGMGLIGLALVAMTGCQSAAKPQGDSWSAIEDRGKLVVGIDDTFAPMGFRDENNELAGYDIEMAKAVSEKLGIAFEFQTIDWSMKESELNSGNIDLIWNGYSITDTRKQQVAFSEPYLENRQLIITLADSEVNSKADLAGKTIAVQKESSALEAVSADAAFTSALKNGAPEEFDTNIDCFMDLEAGRSQAIVVDEVLARYVMKQRGQEKYKVLDENFGTEQYAVGMRKQDTTLLEKINEAMKACNEDGTTAALNAKWFGE